MKDDGSSHAGEEEQAESPLKDLSPDEADQVTVTGGAPNVSQTQQDTAQAQINKIRG